MSLEPTKAIKTMIMIRAELVINRPVNDRPKMTA